MHDLGVMKFTDLIAWQKAYDLSINVKSITDKFPPGEAKLVEQMRASSSSIPYNIAEGFGRFAAKEQAHFHSIARGSADELKVQRMQSREWGYCRDANALISLADEVCAMLYVFRKKVLERDSER